MSLLSHWPHDPQLVHPDETSEAVATSSGQLMKVLRHHSVSSILFGIVMLVALFVIWPAQRGGHLGITVVSGHSMEPTMHTGDVVLTWKHATYAVGDVVVYPVPDGPGAGIDVVHRIIGFQPDGSLITRGDNNHGPDPWHPTAASVVGSEMRMVPAAGNGLDFLRRPIFGILVLSVIAGACAYWLALDLSSKESDTDEGAEADTE